MKHYVWKVTNVTTRRSDPRIIDVDQQHRHLQMDGVHLEPRAGASEKMLRYGAANVWK